MDIKGGRYKDSRSYACESASTTLTTWCQQHCAGTAPKQTGEERRFTLALSGTISAKKCYQCDTNIPTFDMHQLIPRVHNLQECATACTTSMQCFDGRTSHHVAWFKRLHRQTVQSDRKRVVPKAGLRTTLYLSCTEYK